MRAASELLSMIKPGDAFGTASRGCGSAGIRFCAGGPLSHIFIAVPHRDDPNRVVEYESTNIIRQRCLYQKRRVSGVQVHPIAWRIRHELERGGKVFWYPLVNPLTGEESAKLFAMSERLLGVPYDYWGAWLARRWGFRWATRLLYRSMIDRKRLYCSEAGEVLFDACDRLAGDCQGALAPSPLMKRQVAGGEHGKPFEMTLAML